MEPKERFPPDPLPRKAKKEIKIPALVSIDCIKINRLTNRVLFIKIKPYMRGREEYRARTPKESRAR